MSSPNQLSFLPEDYLERKAQRRTNAVCGLLFLVVMTAIGSAFAVNERANREQVAAHAHVDRQWTEAATPIKQFQLVQERQQRMAQQAELTASLLEKMQRSVILAEITNSRPAGTSLLDFALTSKVRTPRAPAGQQPKTAFEQKKAEIEARNKKVESTPPPPSPTVYDVSIKITGVAINDVQVAQLLSRLSRSDYFRDVNLVISEEFKQGEEKLRKFQIEMMLNPEAEARQPTATSGTAAAELKMH